MPLPKQYDAAEAEKRWQNHWLEREIYAWDETQPRENTFVIDTPPPTVSGLLHMGHIFSYTQADFVARFQRMLGKTVFYPMGFDDNGLPTERLVEKVKKIRAVDLGREKFIEECESVAEEARNEFRNLFRSVALSVDWNQEYHTISDEARAISQASFIDLLEKGHAYRELKPFFWDPVDQTAIASAEIEDKELPSHFSDIRFYVEDESRVASRESREDIRDSSHETRATITIGTTRPELIPACVGVFYHPDDVRYQHLRGKFAITPLFGVRVPILEDDSVEPEKGTGIMMCCTFGDEKDIEKWKKHGLETRVILNKFGKLENLDKLGKEWPSIQTPELLQGFMQALTGLKVSNTDPKHPGARQKILELLKESGELIESKPITHAVKCAERSGAPLEILPTHQWFVRITDKKDALKSRAAECNWHPEYMRYRIDQWIDGLNQDWCISRQRFFGVPFPVWYSKRVGEEGKIITASADQLPVNPLVDLPRGYTRDEVTPEADVMDTWATSSISPQLSAGAIKPSPSGRGLGEGSSAPETKFYDYPSEEIIQRARALRHEGTPPEQILWSILRDRQIEGAKFRRQHPIPPYTADFFCHEAKLVVELDGHSHFSDEGIAKDKQRTQYLDEKGYRVLRFTNHDVMENMEGVWQSLSTTLKGALTPALSQRERGLSADDRYHKLFPADIRPQAHEIIRTWAFYTIVKSHLHADTIPWKDLMISGWCLAADKTKMSKSKGNVVTPTALIEEKGADAVRYWASTSRLGADTAFSEDLLKIGRKLVTKLWNAASFASLNLDKLTAIPATTAQDIVNGRITETLDHWVLSRLAAAVATATESFEAFEYADARAAVDDWFWNDFCDNYLELVKARAYGENSQNGQQSALLTLHHCLNTVLKLYAPFIPHVTEELFSHIFSAEYARTGSIHARGMWPNTADFSILPDAEIAGAAAVQILNAIRKAKSERNVSIKYPLTKVRITPTGDAVSGVEAALPDIAAAGNAAQIQIDAAPDTAPYTVHYTTENGAWQLSITFAETTDAI